MRCHLAPCQAALNDLKAGTYSRKRSADACQVNGRLNDERGLSEEEMRKRTGYGLVIRTFCAILTVSVALFLCFKPCCICVSGVIGG